MTIHPGLRRTRAQVGLIDGSWRKPTVVVGSLTDPNTGDVLQPQLASAADVVEQALDAADVLHRSGDLARLSIEARADVLDEIAAGLTFRTEDLAYEDAMSTGNAIKVARSMASYIGPRVRGSLEQLRSIGEDHVLDRSRGVTLLRRPLGPAVVLAPWNAPTFVAVAKLSSALAAGCPVILKPSEWAPGGCQIVAEVIDDVIRRHGLPPATFQLVHGAAAVGSQLAGDPRVRAISFTGGAPAGRAVAAAAAPALHRPAARAGRPQPRDRPGRRRRRAHGSRPGRRHDEAERPVVRGARQGPGPRVDPGPTGRRPSAQPGRADARALPRRVHRCRSACLRAPPGTAAGGGRPARCGRWPPAHRRGGRPTSAAGSSRPR